MRLQADDHKILMPKLGGIVGAARPYHALFTADPQFEPIGAHCGKMCAPRDQADIGARARKLHTNISADRAGAVDTDFHEATPGPLVKCRHELPAGSEENFRAMAIF